MLGGQERECRLLAEEFIRRGWSPVVVTEQLGLDTPQLEHADGITVHRIPSTPERTLRTQLFVAVQMARLVLRYRRRVRFAIVRTATLPAVVLGALKVLRAIRFPTLVTAETGGTADDIVALAERPLFPAARALVSAHDWLNGICQANVDHLREYGFPDAKITFIPNGIDTRAWRETDPPQQIERFLFLGRLDPEKGLFELLDAFGSVHAAHPSARLTVAGEGPAGPALERRAAELGLQGSVTFAGRVAYEQLGNVFSSHDCLVLPSYSEGMPLSVLEAAAHRRALIVTDVGDMRLMFGEHIRIVPPRDTDALAVAMADAVAERRPRIDYGDVLQTVSISTVATSMLERLGVAD